MSKISLYISFLGPISIICFSSLLILNSVLPEVARSQFIFFIIGFILFALISRIDYMLYMFSAWPWYIISNLLLLFTLIFGVTTRGSTRWFQFFGYTFQTSEFVKPLLILFLAGYLSLYLPRSVKSLFYYLILTAIPIFLIFLQPDLGTATLIAFTSVAALVASGVNFKYIGLLILIGLLIVPLSYSQFKPYQQQRIISFIDPNVDPLGSGYNALQATIAVGSGRFIGRGLGQGTQSHLRFLPERHSDFIYAAFVEELGFIGGGILILAYLWLAYTLIKTARRASSDTGSLICLISVSLILIQAGVNIGMNMGLLPITGVTLPLVSAGGSSIISFMLILGICFSVALRPTHHRATFEIH